MLSNLISLHFAKFKQTYRIYLMHKSIEGLENANVIKNYIVSKTNLYSVRTYVYKLEQ